LGIRALAAISWLKECRKYCGYERLVQPNRRNNKGKYHANHTKEAAPREPGVPDYQGKVNFEITG
jgi:hypothetical protein